MKRALCAASMIVPVFVVGMLALPRWLPADSNPLTVTMWWMIFNQPAACRGGGTGICTGTDLSNTEPNQRWCGRANKGCDLGQRSA